MFKKTAKHIQIASFILCLSFSANAKDGYYQPKQSSYNFALMSNEFQITSLMNATLEGNYQAVSIFLSAGANPNQKNIAECTALHFAGRKGNSDIIQLLLDNKANPNLKDIDGWTPLMRASMAGDAKSVETLINGGAYIWYLNEWKESALVHSAMSNCFECARILIERTDMSEMKDRKPVQEQVVEAQAIVNKKYNVAFKSLLDDFDAMLSGEAISPSKIRLAPKPAHIEEIDLNQNQTPTRETTEEKDGFVKRTLNKLFTIKKVDETNKYEPQSKSLNLDQDYTEDMLEDVEEAEESEKIEEIDLNEGFRKRRDFQETDRSKGVIPREKPREYIEDEVDEVDLDLVEEQEQERPQPQPKSQNARATYSEPQEETATSKRAFPTGNATKKSDSVYKSIVPREKGSSKETLTQTSSPVSTKKAYSKPATTSYSPQNNSSSYDRLVPKAKTPSIETDTGSQFNFGDEGSSSIERFLR